MNQTDLFNKAIVAKLAGDDEAFKSAVSEAIKAKAKSLLSAAKPISEAGRMAPTEQFGLSVYLTQEALQHLGLQGEEGEFDAEGTAEVHYSAAEEQTRDHPGSSSELDFNIVSAGVWINDQLTQVDPRAFTQALSEEEYSELHDKLKSEIEEKGAESQALAHAARFGRVPDDY